MSMISTDIFTHFIICCTVTHLCAWEPICTTFARSIAFAFEARTSHQFHYGFWGARQVAHHWSQKPIFNYPSVADRRWNIRSTLFIHFPHHCLKVRKLTLFSAGKKAPVDGGILSPKVCLVVNIHHLSAANVLIFVSLRYTLQINDSKSRATCSETVSEVLREASVWSIFSFDALNTFQ